MNENWRNAFGSLMCREICDGTGAGRCDGSPSTCSSLFLFLSHGPGNAINCAQQYQCTIHPHTLKVKLSSIMY